MNPPALVLFEDAHVLVVDKPAGLLSVAAPGVGGPAGRNLADLLRRAAGAAGGGGPFAVHRLDRDTSGAIVFAKTQAAKRALEAAFRERTVEKHYLALVNGRPGGARGPAAGTVTTYIADRGKAAVSSRRPIPGGRPAVTRWRIVERLRGATLVDAEPHTGRFNQIRLHMADLGCPLVGERKYAVASRLPLKFKRPLLHAASLDFPHPADTKRRVHVEAPLPEDFAAFVASLRLA